MKKSFLFVVDDDESVLDALEFMLQGEGYEPLCFSSAEAFLDFIQKQSGVLQGCLVLDSRMPGMSGQELQVILQQNHKTLGIIFITGHGDVPMAVDALKLGAVDFLQKPIYRESLLSAVEAALSYSKKQIYQKNHIEKYQKLTQRERDILALLANGKNNLEVSNILHISPRTVEVHKASTLRHLDVTTLAEMIKIYIQIEPFIATIPPPPMRIRRKK
ncbi:response regulator [Providencia huaxiensis]|uniref:response regulator transcription factor n=1 Tax=Providencia TaxID=586 RepID=UPI0014092449|nr:MULTISPECIES: response regulator [Providencia]MBN6362075.1 response regulator transcription factor [Providencia huaxiensis]QPE17183.1 response regulator transcription factor [Providencia rettgeri]QQE94098.1 response regulator transcription factor [Providencia rettgeri]QWJ92563.1 response regulator [Providencia rettgeri]